ncbi:MAG: hypothetical protein ABI837_13505 [Acidobacteriota bacterium]
MRKPAGILSLLLILTAPVASAAGYIVIVNSANNTTSLSSRDVAALFLKKKTSWENGTPVMPVVLSDSAAATTAFDTEILRRSANAIRAYWQQEIFSGRDVPPLEEPGDQEVVNFVQKNPGAIGFISANAPHAGVKVVSVSGALVGNPKP